MKNIFYNLGYFLKEVKTIFLLNRLTNIFSIFSIGMIFFVLAMAISGWWISNQIVEAIQGEAEINIYYDENIGDRDVSQLLENIKEISGVSGAVIVDEDEAYSRMVEIMGKEAKVLELFDENPFSSFIEVQIELEGVNPISDKLSLLNGIEHVRDNKAVLDRISNISKILKVVGLLIVAAVGISTLIIISHIIRSGIYNNREEINTLRLLGAPEIFIGFPFIIEGFLLTLAGGGIAIVLSLAALKYVYAQMTGPLPFIPLPPLKVLASNLTVLVLAVSMLLGIAGSMFGLSSFKKK